MLTAQYRATYTEIYLVYLQVKYYYLIETMVAVWPAGISGQLGSTAAAVTGIGILTS